MTAFVRGKADVPATSGNYADELLAQIWQHSIETPDRPAFVGYLEFILQQDLSLHLKNA